MTASRTSSAVVAASSRASQTPPGRRGSARPVAMATRGLADPARPDDLDEPPAARAARPARRSPSSRPTSSADSDGRFPARRGRAAPGRGRGPAARARRSRGPGLEAELVRQPGADPLVGRQRVGLAPRAVQRGDQQLPQALPVRVGRHGRLELADHVASPSRSRAASRVSSELRARLLEPRPVRGGPVAGRRQHVAAEARQRRRAQLGGAAVVAGVEPPRRGGGVAQRRAARRPASGSTASR